MRRVAFNSAILLGVNLTGAGLGFVLSVVTARALGVDDFGRYTLALAWSFALGLFGEFGLNTLLTRDLAQRRADVSAYLTAATLIKTMLSLALIAALEWAAPVVSRDPPTIGAIRLAAPLIWLNALYGSFTAIFRAFERMLPILLLNTGGLIVQLGLTVIVVATGGHLIELVGLAVAVQLAQIIAAYAIYRARFRSVPARGFDLRLVKQLGRVALPFAIAGVLGAIQLRANVLLLGSLRGESAVGIFSAAARWAEAAKVLPYAFFGAIFPRLSFLAREPAGQLELTFRRSEQWLLVFALVAALALTLAAHPLLVSTYGAAFAPAVPTLQILGWLIVPALWNGLTVLYLYALGGEGFVNWVSAASLALQILAAFPLIALWGAAGAALSSLVGECAMVIPFWLRRRSQALRRRYA